MPASDVQVQHFVDGRMRPFAQLMRSIYLKSKDNKAVIGDVYAALAAESPTWTDTNATGPPHLITVNDVLAWNAFMDELITFVEANAQWSVILEACINPPG